MIDPKKLRDVANDLFSGDIKNCLSEAANTIQAKDAEIRAMGSTIGRLQVKLREIEAKDAEIEFLLDRCVQWSLDLRVVRDEAANLKAEIERSKAENARLVASLRCDLDEAALFKIQLRRLLNEVLDG